MRIYQVRITDSNKQAFGGKKISPKASTVIDNSKIQLKEIITEIELINSKRANNRAIWEAGYRNTPRRQIPFGPVEADSWSTYDEEEARLSALLFEKARLEKLISK